LNEGVATGQGSEGQAEARAALLRARAALEAVEPNLTAGAVRAIDAAVARIDAGAAGEAPKRDLLSIVCHDLKDPLSSIVMGAGFLKRAIPEDEVAAPQRRVALAILRASERMNQLIGDFHDLGKLEAGRLPLELHAHEIGALLRAAFDQVAPAVRARGLELVLDVADEATRAVCDRGRVLQMVQKLVDNAIKFTPEGSGKITLHTARREDAACFAVSDTGRGVPEARKATVFDRETNAAQTPRDGPGLGLAIVRELATLHGGKVGVRDADGGQGATFWFTLPLG
jgi:signal transduction histidine kinase